MKKELSIEGMMCQNCVKHVTRALENIPGVSQVSVSLENKNATLFASQGITDEALKAAVTDAGYDVMEIKSYES